VAGLLVLLSLVLITAYFREPAGGGLHGVQSAGATVLRPFEVGAERVARPFRDAYGWFAGLLHAKSENERLRSQIGRLSSVVVQNENAAAQLADLKRQLNYIGSPAFQDDFDPVATQVIGKPPTEFEQQITVAAGETDGIRIDDPVVTADGLVGKVTNVTRDQAQVTLLTDPEIEVAAYDLETKAAGVIRHGEGRDTLTLDRVSKSQIVNSHDTIVTQGYKLGPLQSVYPQGVRIGAISGASSSEVDFFWQIQVSPSVHFDSLRSVLVLVPKDRG
jgi:rod shape-determining protein MreC